MHNGSSPIDYFFLTPCSINWHVQVFRTAEVTLALFVSKVQHGYRPNSFHNFDHAFSVAHVSFLMFETVADIRRHLTTVDILR
jgi:hypothetical protein